MDTSERYALLCGQAEEIQKSCGKDSAGYKPIFSGITYDGNDVFYTRNKYNIIWLPRQDQLQGMIEEKYHSEWAIARGFSLFIEEEAEFILKPVVKKTIEQLWLAFIMYEKYQKIWDDEKEEWVKH